MKYGYLSTWEKEIEKYEVAWNVQAAERRTAASIDRSSCAETLKLKV